MRIEARERVILFSVPLKSSIMESTPPFSLTSFKVGLSRDTHHHSQCLPALVKMDVAHRLWKQADNDHPFYHNSEEDGVRCRRSI